MGRESRPVSYQRIVFWATGGQKLKSWNGVSASPTLVDDLTKSDGSAGVNPPDRADKIVLHNEKMFCYRNATSYADSGTSTNIAATVLTDSTSAWTTNALVGYRLYPDVTNFPRRWWIITSNDATTITCSNADITTVATTGDAYLITKSKSKTTWYTTETEPADWPSTSFVSFDEDDGGILQHIASWKGRALVVCSNQVWRVTGYGPSTPWEKELLSTERGTLSPQSVLNAGDNVLWWATDGIAACTGGYGIPELITNNIRSIVLDDLNETMRDEITGTYYRGLILWSYPSALSNVNNRVLLFNIATGRWSVRTFGMYVPTVFFGEDNEEVLYFWEPTSGCICRYDDGYLLASQPQNAVVRTAYIAGSSPTEHSQWLTLRAVIESGGDATGVISVASDYSDGYFPVGTLEPIDTEVTTRTGINATDKVYICRFPATVIGTAISVEMRVAASAALKVREFELTADPVESQTHL